MGGFGHFCEWQRDLLLLHSFNQLNFNECFLALLYEHFTYEVNFDEAWVQVTLNTDM